MDELDRVRQFGDDIRVSESSVEAARGALMTEIASPARQKRARRTWVIGGIGGAALVAAAVTAVALVVPRGVVPEPVVDAATPRPSATVTAPPPTPEPEPSIEAPTASAVFEQAASLAASSAGSSLATSGYLRVETRNEYLTTWPQNSARSTASAAWVAGGTYVTYIPVDRTQEWVRVFEPGAEILALYGDGAEAASRQWQTDLADVIGMRSEIRSRGGLGEGEGEAPRGSDAYYAQMPRDPQSLLEWYGAAAAEGNIDFAQVFWVISQDLELNAAPPDLRASMFRALALAPGVSIQSVVGDETTLSFGHDSGYPNDEVGGGYWTETLTIDTSTGLVVGTSRTMGSGGSVIPDSVPDNRTTTSFSVVPTAP